MTMSTVCLLVLFNILRSNQNACYK